LGLTNFPWAYSFPDVQLEVFVTVNVPAVDASLVS